MNNNYPILCLSNNNNTTLTTTMLSSRQAIHKFRTVASRMATRSLATQATNSSKGNTARDANYAYAMLGLLGAGAGVAAGVAPSAGGGTGAGAVLGVVVMPGSTGVDGSRRLWSAGRQAGTGRWMHPHEHVTKSRCG